jgi:hypothetical protein
LVPKGTKTPSKENGLFFSNKRTFKHINKLSISFILCCILLIVFQKKKVYVLK